MGLDQYAYRVKKGIINGAIPKNIPSDDLEEIAYWRKHPNLQGWMEKLYNDKGGSDMFNCQFVQLTENDLALLQDDILHNALVESTGPFWGSDSDDYYRRDDFKFIETALGCIKKGYDIVYYSWW